MIKHHDQSHFQKSLFGIMFRRVRVHDGGALKAWWQEQEAVSSHPELQAPSRKRKLLMVHHCSLASSPSPSDILPPGRPHPLHLPKHHHQLVTKYSISEPMKNIPIQTTTFVSAFRWMTAGQVHKYKRAALHLLHKRDYYLMVGSGIGCVF